MTLKAGLCLTGRFTALFPAGLILLLLAAQAAEIVAGQAFLPQHSHGPLTERLLSWNGRFYFGIMRRGYEWAPANLQQTQNIAFFPAQALLH